METWRHHYNIVYKILSLTGTWPYLKPRARIFRVAVMTIVILTVLVPQAMTSYLLTCSSLLKVYTLQLNIRTIESLTQHIFLDWKELKTPEEYKILKIYAQNSRRFCLVYAVYCMSTVAAFMSLSFVPLVLDTVWPLNESRPITPPYPGYYFVELREYFFNIFWHSIIAWEITVAGIIAHDCIFVTFVEHVCSIFTLVGYYFENLFNKSDETMKITNNSNDNYREKIAFFVHKHRDALKFVELIEHIFTIPFAAQIIVVTIGLSVTLLQFTQQEGDILISIKYVLYVIAQLFHLFCLSFEGQKLIDHSIQMCDKIYSSTWYEVSMKSQKLIVMVMMKSVRPSFLSAGKIYILSLESFTMVLQTSMSYFTVLASI